MMQTSKSQKRFSVKFFGGLIVGLGILAAGVVQAAVINASSKLGAGATDNLLFESSTTFTGTTHKFPSITIGEQDVGGVTFFNGTIVNATVTDSGGDIPVTFGDNVRIDGRVWRGEDAGPEEDGSLPFLVNDHLQVEGNNTVAGDETITGDIAVTGNETVTGNSTVTGDLAVTGNATITGTLTVGEEEVATTTIANTDVAETITGDWVNTANPWAANEIANVTRTINFPLLSFYNVDGTNAAAIGTTSASTQPVLGSGSEGNFFIRWSSADTDPIGAQFQVPTDYDSGGVFKVDLELGGTVTGDNDILGKTWVIEADESATTKTFTAMTGGTNFDVGLTANDIVTVTLTPASTATLEGGDHVSFSIERSGGTDNVTVQSVVFGYTAAQ